MEEVRNEETKATKAEKAYTLKKLSAANLFTFSTIMNKIGFSEFKACFQSKEIQQAISESKTESGINIESVGVAVIMDVASIILKNLEKCKDNIYQLLSDLSGMKKREIEALDMNVFIEMIIDVFQKEEFKDFFKVASKLFK